MSSTDIAARRPAALPPALAEIGVQIATDDSGYRAVIFPPEVRQRCNLLLPISEVASADANFSPSVRIVQLDVAAHTYESNQQRGKYALNKQGLEILGNCAGVLYQKTGRIPKHELEDDELGYWGEVAIRRSDGTMAVFRKERVVNREVEEYKIRSAVAKMNKTDQEKHRIFESRWLAEREHMRAKCESKAILRALRDALNVPHLFTPQELQKPFVVVGYSFTPDYNDPDMKRLLVQHGLAATSAIYGEPVAIEGPTAQQREADRILPSEEQVAEQLGLASGEPEPSPDMASPKAESAGGEEGLGATTTPPATNPEADLPQRTEPTTAGGGASTQESSASPPAPAPSTEPEPPAPSPAAPPTSGVVLSFGRYQGSTIDQIYEKEPSYVEWLANSARDPDVREAAMRAMTEGRA